MTSEVRTSVSLISAASITTGSWAMVFPFLYLDVTAVRHLGSATAGGVFAAYAVGTVVAAPLGAQLLDRMSLRALAVLARIATALSVVALGYAHTSALVLATGFAVGATTALGRLPVQLLLIAHAPHARRREFFGWSFIGMNTGAAGGTFLGGFLVDLAHPAAMHRLYWAAAAVSLLSAVLLALVDTGTAETGREGRATRSGPYLQLLRDRRIRWVLVVTMLLTLACWAQFSSGLPAYVLAGGLVSPTRLGTFIAVSDLVVAALMIPVTTRTREHNGATLLVICSFVWLGCWLLFAAPLVVHGANAQFVLAGFVVLAIGDTLMAPVLSPLAADLAPEQLRARSLAAVSGTSNLAIAIGPLLAGLLLGLNLRGGYVLLQMVACLGAAAAALRLRALMPARTGDPVIKTHAEV